MISFDLPLSCLPARNHEEEEDGVHETDDVRDEEDESQVQSVDGDQDTLHVHIEGVDASPNTEGSVADVAARYTAKELKTMLSEKGVASASGDKRALAKKLIAVNSSE